MKRRTGLKAGLILMTTATVALIFRPVGAAARVLSGGAPWAVKETLPPAVVDPTQRVFLTDPEVTQLTAIFDRLIPADALSVSASQAGCVVFIDHQLGGPYGKGAWLYRAGPLQPGTKQQGEQTAPLAPADLYRIGLKEMDAHCQGQNGKPFAELSSDEQDIYLDAMQAGQFQYPSMASDRLFTQLLTNVMEGFFADPIYGGNKDMAGWKMIGFPGARYDYRDVLPLKGKPMNIEPVSLLSRI